MIIISIAASLLCLIGTICVYYIIKKKDTAYKTESITNQSNDSDQPRPLADFRIDSVEAEFNIKFREKMISSISFDMVANREGIDYFEKAYFGLVIHIIVHILKMQMVDILSMI